MATVEYKKNCELCHQPVEIMGFELKVESTVFSFCCAGCQSIYKLIYIDSKDRIESLDIQHSKTINNSNEDNNK